MARSTVTAGKLGKIALELGVDGIDAIKARVAEKIQDLGGQEAKKVFMQAGLEVVREIRGDIHNVTGTLSSAIFASYGRPDKSNVIVGVKIGRGGVAPYAPAVEHGHVIRHGGRGKAGQVTGQVPPHEFFKPGVKAASPTAGVIIIEGLKGIASK